MKPPICAVYPRGIMDMLERLCELSEARFDKVLYAMGLSPAVLSGKQAPLATRATELLHWAEHQGRLPDLERFIDAETSPPRLVRGDWWLSGAFLVAVAILVAALLAAGVTDPRTWGLALTVVDVAQLLVIIPVLYYVWLGDTARFEAQGDEAAGRSQECVEQFVFYWENIWIVWLVFYGFAVARGVVEHSLPPEIPRAQYWNTANNLFIYFVHHHQSATFFLLFLMMIKPTLDAESHLHQKRRWATLVWVGCTLILMMQLLIFSSLVWRGRFEAHALTVDFCMALLNGLATGTCMGIFFGRLESRFLDLRPIELFAFYGYAAIQPLFTVINALRNVPWQPAYWSSLTGILLKALACALKLGLFFAVRRQIKSGRLAFYMHKVRVSRTALQREWESFQRERLGPPSSRRSAFEPK